MAKLSSKKDVKKVYKGVKISPKGIELPWGEIAKGAKTTAKKVKDFAKENPNTFVATLIAGPVGYLLGRKMDNIEKREK